MQEVVPYESQTPDAVVGPVESLLPYFPDDERKLVYLAYRCSGFTTKEARAFAGVEKDEVDSWMTSDSLFSDIELATPSLRKEVGYHYQQMKHLRNSLMWLNIDEAIIEKRMRGEDLSRQEHQTLMKRATTYTPDAQAKYAELLGELQGKSSDAPLDMHSWLQNLKSATFRERTVEVSRG